MKAVKAYAAKSAEKPLEPWQIDRREPGPDDVEIEILFCGVCHSGVGCFVDSCGHCKNCNEHNEQYCENGHTQTYNSYSQDKKTITYGGYSSHIVVTEKFVLQVSNKLPLQEVAPLLCAGITTYSPLKHWNVKKGDKLAVLGLGGLGHMAVKIASSMGAEVTVLSRSKGKEKDTKRLGASHFKITTDPETMKKMAGSFDFVIDMKSLN